MQLFVAFCSYLQLSVGICTYSYAVNAVNVYGIIVLYQRVASHTVLTRAFIGSLAVRFRSVVVCVPHLDIICVLEYGLGRRAMRCTLLGGKK